MKFESDPNFVAGAMLLVALGCGGSTDPGSRDSTATNAPGSTIPPGPYIPGQSYVGRNGYIEYIAGNAPFIYTAPHGGDQMPAEIPDRTASRCRGSATTTTDLATEELVRAMQQRHFARFGTYPHVIINHLARRKLDANRPELEAACGSDAARIALGEWHAFIDTAEAAAARASGRGWYMDMHGHGHAKQRLEIGYLLTSDRLSLSDAVLDANRAFRDTASIRTMAEEASMSFSALVRGPMSLGSLYAANGFPSVPSTEDPSPESDEYFTGGENTRRHGCGIESVALGGRADGKICGVQIEANFAGVRDTPANRERFADATVTVLGNWGQSRSGRSVAHATERPTSTLTPIAHHATP